MPYHIQYIPQKNIYYFLRTTVCSPAIQYITCEAVIIKNASSGKTPKKTIISWYHFSSHSYQNHPTSHAGSAAPLSAITGGSCQYLANGSILLLQSHVPLTLGHPLSACVGFLCKSAIKVLSFSSLLSHTFLE